MNSICFAFVLCFAAYTAVAGHHEMPEQFKAASDKCVQDMNLDKKVVEEFMHSKAKDTTDENIKCYFKCIMEGLKWMNENGDIVPNNEAGLPDDFVKFGTECKDVTGSNACDKGFKFHICFMEKKHAAHHSAQ